MIYSTSSAAFETVGELLLSPDYSETVARSFVSLALVTASTQDGKLVHTREGTGFCLDERGYYLTALHYLAGADSIFLALGAGEIAFADMIAFDEQLDLALLKVQSKSKLQALRLASAPLQPGDLACGVGYPANRFAVTAAAYLVCYQGCFVEGVDPEQEGVECPALPSGLWFIGGRLSLEGFSGGPMLNEDGEVVAITEMGDGESFAVGTSALDIARFLLGKI